MPYAERFSRALGAGEKAMGGAALNLPIGCMEGDTDMVGVFDDFNGMVAEHEAGIGTSLGLKAMGWVLGDVGSASNETIAMNDTTDGTEHFNSCLSITAGDANDTGLNMQLDTLNATDADVASTPSQRHNFQHIFIPDLSAGATIMDNTTWTFACRIGLHTTDAAGAWDGKLYIGWAEAGDTTILTAGGENAAALPDIAITSVGPFVGFTVNEAGRILGVSHRTVATAFVEGTNCTDLSGASGAVDGTVANGAATVGDTMWFDLALRMDVTNISDVNANGSTTFYHRGPLNQVAPTNAGKDLLAQPGQGFMPWTQHATVLTNQCPDNTVLLVPTIELVNGATETEDVELFLDWWAFGTSRWSRMSRAR